MDLTGLQNVVGQDRTLARIRSLAEQCEQRGLALPHVLLIGPEGSGKRTIAEALAAGSLYQSVAGAQLRTLPDLTAILTNLAYSQMLILSEPKAMAKAAAAALRDALMDCTLTIRLGRGPAYREHRVDLRRFTCIALANRDSDLTPDLGNCFPVKLSLEPYSGDEIVRIMRRIAVQEGVHVDAEMVPALIANSRSTPGSLAATLRRARQIGLTEISTSTVAELLGAIGLPAAGSGTVPNAQFDSLPGEEFERRVCRTLDAMGFRTELTRITGDGGIDIVARLDSPIIGGRYLFQCKRLAPGTAIGAPVVRDFYGALSADLRATKGVIVTTAGFTPQAREFAASVGIELIDRQQLLELLQANGRCPLCSTGSGES